MSFSTIGSQTARFNFHGDGARLALSPNRLEYAPVICDSRPGAGQRKPLGGRSSGNALRCLELSERGIMDHRAHQPRDSPSSLRAPFMTASPKNAQIQLAQALNAPLWDQKNQWALIEAAMQAGASFDLPLEPGRLEHAPSHVAADSCSGSLLRQLWEAYGPWDLSNIEPAEGMTPLLCAAESGNAEAFAFLISHGADPSARAANGAGALLLAAASGGGACFDLAAQARPSDLLELDASGRGLMAICLGANNGLGVARLIQAGADPEGLVERRRPMAIACDAGSDRCVRALLAAGASPNRAEGETRGPLALALALESPACAIALMEGAVLTGVPASAASDTLYTDSAFVKTLSGYCKAYWTGALSSLAEQEPILKADPAAVARASASVLNRASKPRSGKRGKGG